MRATSGPILRRRRGLVRQPCSCLRVLRAGAAVGASRQRPLPGDTHPAGRDAQAGARFGALLSHYVIENRYGRPGKENDKGAGEGIVGWSRRNFMVPLPRFATWDDFNDWLEEQRRKRQAEILRGHGEMFGERFQRDLAAMMPLPAAPFEACEQATRRVSSQTLVRYKTNDWSVPAVYGHRGVWIRGYVDEVVIGGVSLLEQKIAALDQAAPLVDWGAAGRVPTCGG